jgi:hypothetical protein
VAAKHAFEAPISEPEAFVDFDERLANRCVLAGLIGSRHEIHVGDEASVDALFEGRAMTHQVQVSAVK